MEKSEKKLYENRYMLSVQDKRDIRWIRHPFMSKSQLDKFLFLYLKDPVRYQNLEIFMETTLDIEVANHDEIATDRLITLRETLFGNFYQENVSFYQNVPKFREHFG